MNHSVHSWPEGSVGGFKHGPSGGWPWWGHHLLNQDFEGIEQSDPVNGAVLSRSTAPIGPSKLVQPGLEIIDKLGLGYIFWWFLTLLALHRVSCPMKIKILISSIWGGAKSCVNIVKNYLKFMALKTLQGWKFLGFYKVRSDSWMGGLLKSSEYWFAYKVDLSSTTDP